jgi:hypothetical protein
MSQPPPALADGSTTHAHAPENPLSPHDRRRIAVTASCDPSCVVQYVLGKSMRSTTISRIEKALRNLDLEHVIALRQSALAVPR